MYASKTSFGSPYEGSPSPGPESLYGSRQGLQGGVGGDEGEVVHKQDEQQEVEEDENMEEVDEEENKEQEVEQVEAEYLTMASILTVVPTMKDVEGGPKEEKKEDMEQEGKREAGVELDDKEVEEINSVDQQQQEEMETAR